MSEEIERTSETPKSDTLSPIELTPEQIARARGDDDVESPVEEPVVEEPEDHETDPVQEASAESGGEGGKEAAWITESVRGEAAELGLDEDDLSGFASEVAFRRVAAKLHRPQEAASTEEPAKEESDLALLDVAKFEEAEYDEDTLSIVRSHNAMVERLRALEPVVSQFQDQQRAAAEEAQFQKLSGEFDKWADTKEESVFGRSEKLGAEHLDSRRKVFDAMWDLAQVLHSRGEKVPELAVLAERAARMELSDKLAQARDAAIRKQAARRRPVSVASAAPEKGSHKEAVAFWQKAQEENGE